MGRFSQAISEGDGISVIPVLEGDVAALAGQADSTGAEAVAVWTAEDVEQARLRSRLPVLVREAPLPRSDDLGSQRPPDADACILVFERLAADPYLEDLGAFLAESGVDCVVDVRDDEELAEALARLDPEIILVSERDREAGEEPFERALDVLPDVPAGKLFVAESRLVAREQVLALERAGVDGVLVPDLAPGAGFAAALGELVGDRRAGL